MDAETPRAPIKWWHWLLLYPALVTALLGALPTAWQAFRACTAAGTVCWRVRAIAGTVVSDPSNVACLTSPHAPVNVRVTITLSGTVQ